MAQTETVTIGLVTYNEDRTLARVIRAIREQSHSDFICYWSDNGSTDATLDVGRRAVAGDPRFIEVHEEKNLGAAVNFNKVRALAQTEYFCWASGHDAWSPTFLEAHLEALRARPEAGLAFGEFYPDNYGVNSPITLNIPFELGAWWRVDLFYSLAGSLAVLDPVYGLFRTSVLRRLPEWRSCWGPDTRMLARLVEAHEIVGFPGVIFERGTPPARALAPDWVERYFGRLTGERHAPRFLLTHLALVFYQTRHLWRLAHGSLRLRMLAVGRGTKALAKQWRGVLFHDVLGNAVSLFVGRRAWVATKRRVYEALRARGWYS